MIAITQQCDKLMIQHTVLQYEADDLSPKIIYAIENTDSRVFDACNECAKLDVYYVVQVVCLSRIFCTHSSPQFHISRLYYRVFFH